MHFWKLKKARKMINNCFRFSWYLRPQVIPNRLWHCLYDVDFSRLFRLWIEGNLKICALCAIFNLTIYCNALARTWPQTENLNHSFEAEFIWLSYLTGSNLPNNLGCQFFLRMPVGEKWWFSTLMAHKMTRKMLFVLQQEFSCKNVLYGKSFLGFIIISTLLWFSLNYVYVVNVFIHRYHVCPLVIHSIEVFEIMHYFDDIKVKFLSMIVFWCFWCFPLHYFRFQIC